MSQDSEPKNEFRFLLNTVRSESLRAVALELTNLFPLDLPTAVNITKNAPIILLDKLTAQQARTVGTYATRLKALGAEVQVTSAPVGKLQVLRWPLMPDIAKRPGNHIICPSCGARLQVQVHVPSPGAAPAPLTATAEAPAAEEKPRPLPTTGAPAEPEPAAPPAQLEPAAAQAPVTEPEDDLVSELVLEPVGGEEPLELSDEAVVLEEAPGQAPKGAPAAPPPSAPGQPVGGEGTCRVMLVGKIRGKKKVQAAELMAYYQGITVEEATAQLSRTVVTVARDLTEEQAEVCKREFADAGVRVKFKS